MKFISKNTNLHIILRPGQQAIPMTGTPAVPTISVRFQNGMADINDTNLVEMMQRHPGFNQDFIAADEIGSDPYINQRTSTEPQYVTTELKYGHAESRTVSGGKPMTLSPEVQALINNEAQKIALTMVKAELPGLVAAALQQAQGEAPTAGPVEETIPEAGADAGYDPVIITQSDAEEVVTPTPTTPNPRNKRSSTTK